MIFEILGFELYIAPWFANLCAVGITGALIMLLGMGIARWDKPTRSKKNG